MNNMQLQIQFPRPGQWDQFTLTAVYRDAEGYIRTDRYTQKEIPSNYLEAFAGVVSVLCVLSDDWQARQVWACLHDAPALEEEDFQDSSNIAEVVVLTVEAVNAGGGRRMFTSAHYPKFAIDADTAVAFFKHFTGFGNSGMKNGIEVAGRKKLLLHGEKS